MSTVKIQTQFDEGLQKLRPSLFCLADKLWNAYDDKNWNLLIGDDTSGRLVTRFARLALTNAGIRIPTHYIAASKSVHHLKPLDTFDMYARHITNDLHPRALLITESTSKEPNSLRFTHGVVGPHCQLLDMAVLGLRQAALAPLEELGSVYYGHIEDKSLQTAVWQTFENPTGESEIQSARSAPLTNLQLNPNLAEAHAKRSSNTEYGNLFVYAYERMDKMADEWAESRLG